MRSLVLGLTIAAFSNAIRIQTGQVAGTDDAAPIVAPNGVPFEAPPALPDGFVPREEADVITAEDAGIEPAKDDFAAINEDEWEWEDEARPN